VGFFYGRETSAIDSKGRCTIPAPYRRKLNPENNGEFILIMSRRGCIKAYPRDIWDMEFSGEISKGMKVRKSLYRLTALTLSRMAEIQMDKQGRILIPDFMRDHAQLKDSVQVNGCHTFLELWSVSKFREYETDTLMKAEADDEELPFTY
jgi:MraZ protein